MDFDKSLDELKDQIDRFREKGVDKCFIPSTYVHAYQISKIINSLDTSKFNEDQKRRFNELDNELFAQFRRLSEGRCKCTINKDI